MSSLILIKQRIGINFLQHVQKQFTCFTKETDKTHLYLYRKYQFAYFNISLKRVGQYLIWTNFIGDRTLSDRK